MLCCVVRYGNNFRGMKAAIGAKFGCVGVLIYSDPADDGDTLGPVYGSAPPGGPFRPSSGVQRGSAEDISLFAGDPMTPRHQTAQHTAHSTQHTFMSRAEQSLSPTRLPPALSLSLSRPARTNRLCSLLLRSFSLCCLLAACVWLVVCLFGCVVAGVAHLTADQATTYSMSNSPVLPTIPVHPISYGDAAMFLSAMTGVSVSDPGIPFPDSWKTGGLFGANQHIGLLSNYSSTLNNDTISYMPVQAELFLDLPFAVRPISDVVATIIGSDYPDEWVILGNHRDAWVYGGVDPHQGTAVLVELARVFGVMLSQGWQPKRSIKLCSWDAEEQALIGSTEWVEDMVANQQLQSKAVVYINVDVAVEAWPKADSNPVLPIIDVGAVPSLGAIAVQIANSVADPWRTTSSTNVSLLSSWQQYGVNGANVSDLGSGSDYSAFLQFAGIPSLSLEFGPGKGDKAPYGVYHSVYDSDMYDHMYMDPDNNGKYAMAQYWGLLALNLTDSLVLPFHYSDYADRISGHLVEIQQYANTLTSCIGALDFQPLQLALSNFTTAAVALDQQLAGLNASATLNSTAVVALNRLLVSTEQSFLAVDDLFPGRPYLWYRHVLVAPGLWAGYDSEAFPAVHDAIEGEIGTGRWQCTAPDVRKQNATDQINNAARAINSATVKLNAAYALTTSGPPPPPPIELSSSSSSSAGAFSSSSESAVSSSSSVSSSSVSSSSSASSSSSSSSSSQNQSLAVTSSSSSSSFPSSSSSSSSSSLAPSSSSSSSHPSSSSSSSYSSSSSSSSSSSNNTTASYGSVSRRSGAKAVRGEHFLDVARVLREEDDSNQ